MKLFFASLIGSIMFLIIIGVVILIWGGGAHVLNLLAGKSPPIMMIIYILWPIVFCMFITLSVAESNILNRFSSIKFPIISLLLMIWYLLPIILNSFSALSELMGKKSLSDILYAFRWYSQPTTIVLVLGLMSFKIFPRLKGHQ